MMWMTWMKGSFSKFVIALPQSLHLLSHTQTATSSACAEKHKRLVPAPRLASWDVWKPHLPMGLVMVGPSTGVEALGDHCFKIQVGSLPLENK